MTALRPHLLLRSSFLSSFSKLSPRSFSTHLLAASGHQHHARAHLRLLSSPSSSLAASLRRTYAAFNPNPNPQPSFPDLSTPSPEPKDASKDKKGGGGILPFAITSSPALDAALATFVGLLLVFGSGIAYLAWYKVSPERLSFPQSRSRREGGSEAVELTSSTALPLPDSLASLSSSAVWPRPSRQATIQHWTSRTLLPGGSCTRDRSGRCWVRVRVERRRKEKRGIL